VWQGKVWVFGEAGPQAFIDSAAVKPALVEELAESWPPREPDGERFFLLTDQYMRDLPYGWGTLVENGLDPSHVNFAHHGVIGDRRARVCQSV
jgi:phenylpropionate dioxygenase-like ring-hydroxylating dioxygenase large terminal subunit